MMHLQISELSLQSPLLHNVRYNTKAREVLQRRAQIDRAAKQQDPQFQQ